MYNVTNGFKVFGEVVKQGNKWSFIYNGRTVKQFDTLWMAQNYIKARYGLIIEQN